MPAHVREWVTRLQYVHEAHPPTIREAKVILDAILTTAMNEQLVAFHAGRGVKTPPVGARRGYQWCVASLRAGGQRGGSG
jgi:hypothetical protein